MPLRVDVEPPVFPDEELAHLEENLDSEGAVFLRFLRDSLSMDWLEEDDDRLGATRFEGDHNEMYRKKRLKLPPGEITILLHPMLREDSALLRHTMVHELLHAAGLAKHDDEHHELVDSIAPAPALKDSPLLQRLRSQVLGQRELTDWLCDHCGFQWDRKTVRKPHRCPKCARSL